jgi:hypothetical protein
MVLVKQKAVVDKQLPAHINDHRVRVAGRKSIPRVAH